MNSSKIDKHKGAVPAAAAPRFRWLLTGLLLLLLLLPVSEAMGQSAGEYTLKASYIERFTRYIQWPDSVLEGRSTFNCVVLGENPFGRLLEQTFGDRTVGGRPIKITYIDNIDQLGEAHILFVARSERNRMAKIIKEVAGKSMLTVSEIEGAAQLGIHINLYVSGSRLKFEINQKAAESRGFKLSFHLLQRALIVE